MKRMGYSTIPLINFTKEDHIWNISTLRKKIEQNCDIDKLKEIKDHFEMEYGKVTSLPTFDDILIPYEVAFRQQLDESNKNLPHQFYTPFFGRKSVFGKTSKVCGRKS